MKAWKESASIVLAARHKLNINSSSSFGYDYHLLSLKRHKKSNILPGAYVFPGGTTEPADADLKWNELFLSHGFDNNSFKSLIPNANNRSQIFHSRNEEIPREISLRITAIRETFEECGVLLCKSQNQKSSWATDFYVSQNELESWQHKVHSDASEFYGLCKNLGCYPDLWGLHEWSNWLTPSIFKTKARFNAVFFLACMDHIPNAKHDMKEMEDLIWFPPRKLLTSGITMAPPQQYDASKISNFRQLEYLLKFATEQSKQGVTMNFPVIAKLKDGHVEVLPGDSMYPEKPSLFDEQTIDKPNMTIDEFRTISKVLHRIEHYKTNVHKVSIINFDYTDDNLSSLPSESTRGKVKE